MGNIDSLFFKTLAMHVAQGLLACQNPDNKFIDTPEGRREEHFADSVMLYSHALMKRLDKLDHDLAEKERHGTA